MLFYNLDSRNLDVLKSSGKVLKAILHTFKYEEGVIENCAGHFEKIINILNTPLEISNKNTLRCEIKILGEPKLLMIEMLSTLCIMSSNEIITKIISNKLIEKVTLYFEEFNWNSSLHENFFHLVDTILKYESSELLKVLLETSNLPKILIKLANSPCVDNGKKLIRRGSMGYVFKLANLLAKFKDRSDYIKSYLNNDIDWKSFEITVLAKQNAINNLELGGRSNTEYFDTFSSEEENQKLIENNNTLIEDEKEDVFELLDEDQNDISFYENSYWKVVPEFDELEDIN